jgi:RNA polymerase sigma-70 factor (ECF subfamily)
MSQDMSSFEDLIEPISKKMIDSIWRVVRNKHDFEDAFQQALATVWKRLDKVRQHPHPPACVLRICVNAAYDVLRKNRRRQENEVSLESSRPIADSGGDGAQRLQAREREDEILTAISRLPRDQAEAVLMRFTQDASYRDISLALECSEAVARQHICRAREKLTAALSSLLPQSTQQTQS